MRTRKGEEIRMREEYERGGNRRKKEPEKKWENDVIEEKRNEENE